MEPRPESGSLTSTLSADALTVVRGDRCLFRDLSFSLDSGQLLLLEGSNGSGKTSLLKALLGMLELESGTVYWNGQPVANDRAAFHASLVWLAHRTGLKADLSLTENLEFEAALRPASKRELETVLERLQLRRQRKLPLRSLSAGQKRRASLARLLLADAPLWILDEPFTNLDREGREMVLQLVAEHVRGGGLCIMTAHHDIELDVPMQRVGLG